MKKEKEVEEGERSKAHQIPQGGTIRTTGQTWAWRGGEECQIGCEIQAVQWIILSLMFQKLRVSGMLQELPEML